MQEKNIKISIIMPAYNVAKYIEKAINSILRQNFNDFELIIIDDGSNDDTGNICEKYSQHDKRIKVIHQENAGAAIARNNGLKNVNGQYVCFFDADDYIEENMLNVLYKTAIENDSDLVISGFYIHTYYNDNQYLTLNYEPYIDNDKDIIAYNNKNKFRLSAYKNFDKNMFYSPWNKLYKYKYLIDNKIKFPNTYRDDFPFVLNVIKDIQKVTYIKNKYYHFIRKRTDSETQKYYYELYKKREEEHKLMLDLYNSWDLINDKNSFEMISRRYIDRVIECIVNLYNTECDLNEIEKKTEIKKYLNSEYFDISIKSAKPHKIYLRLMYIPLMLKNLKLCALMGKIINSVKKNNIKLFSILKTYR